MLCLEQIGRRQIEYSDVGDSDPKATLIFFIKFITYCNSVFSCPHRRSQVITWINNKDLGVGGELIIVPDGYFPTQNTPFSKALKKALSQWATPQSSAYSPPEFLEWDVSFLGGMGDILARLDFGYVRGSWSNKEIISRIFVISHISMITRDLSV